MAEVKQYICDECQAVKKEANHWWVLFPQSNGSITLFRWPQDDSIPQGLFHLCGQQCVIARLNKFMESAGHVY